MFSLSRAIEEFSIKRQEKRFSQKIEKKRLDSLPHVFRMPLEKLRELFAKPVDELQLNYPKVEYLKNLGFEAFLVTLNVGTETFPTCFNLIKDGKNEVSWNHFEADGKHTLFKISEEFCGRNVHLLTNDIDLIKSISKAGFAPLQLGLFGMSLARSNLIPKATLNIGTTMFGALIGKAEALKRRKNSLLIGEKKRDPIFPMKNGEIGSIRQGSETKRIGRENMTEYIAPLSLWLVVRKRFYKSGVDLPWNFRTS